MHRTALFATLIAANAAAWLWAWVAFGSNPAMLATCAIAWGFGLRHAVDADHIAAIDNTVRKLMEDGEKAVSTGLWFSLGHSTVVIAATLAVATFAAGISDGVGLEDGRRLFGLIGTLVSSGFLLLIAAANLGILRHVWADFRAARTGRAARHAHLHGGVLARFARPLLSAVRRPWHMYPLGLLFGLGFDTATEIGLIGIAAGEAARGLAPINTLVFPALFTAGMALVDTADSALMVRAYGTAFTDPLRRLWYNLTITAASVAAALFVGLIEALGLIGDKLALDGAFWRAVAALNDGLGAAGFAMVAIFALTWGVSALVFRRGPRL